tara:strand:+ start:143 stop:622 length:480 start_codon:yes stop_codon:yes gene_type:complete
MVRSASHVQQGFNKIVEVAQPASDVCLVCFNLLKMGFRANDVCLASIQTMPSILQTILFAPNVQQDTLAKRPEKFSVHYALLASWLMVVSPHAKNVLQVNLVSMMTLLHSVATAQQVTVNHYQHIQCAQCAEKASIQLLDDPIATNVLQGGLLRLGRPI